ncbi:hypothetical protein GCM10007921_37390 [Tritonibacter mobilis]|nr:hypothetical protein GCM10007921_37390 [Tritonibacter mobilis]
MHGPMPGGKETNGHAGSPEDGDGDLQTGTSRQMSDATGLMDWMQDKQI